MTIYYEMRVRPYLTEDKKIDGAFLSFTDITKRKKAEEALDKYAKDLEKLVEERTKQLKDSERLAAIGAQRVWLDMTFATHCRRF